MTGRNTHCSFCGHAFQPDAPWPRTCDQCGQVSYLNPLPVAVTLVPVDDGLLVVRRGIEPGRGRLARPLRQAELAPITLDAETLECLILKQPQELAFSLHTEAVKEYFDGRRA